MGKLDSRVHESASFSSVNGMALLECLGKIRHLTLYVLFRFYMNNLSHSMKGVGNGVKMKEKRKERNQEREGRVEGKMGDKKKREEGREEGIGRR